MLKTNCQATVSPLWCLPFLTPSKLTSRSWGSLCGRDASFTSHLGALPCAAALGKRDVKRAWIYVDKRASLPSPLSFKIFCLFITPLSWTHLMPQGSIRSDLQSWTWGPAPPMTAPQSAQPGISLRGPRLSPPHPDGGLRRATRGCFTLSCEETLTWFKKYLTWMLFSDALTEAQSPDEGELIVLLNSALVGCYWRTGSCSGHHSSKKTMASRSKSRGWWKIRKPSLTRNELSIRIC